MTKLTFAEAERETTLRLMRLADRADASAHHAPGHSSKVAETCAAFAARLGGSDRLVTAVTTAALGQHFGLLTLELPALARPEPLDLATRLELWRHPILAERQLARQGASRQARLIVRWSHEWWNGLGYPDMLAHEAVPIGSRILRLVASYFALGADRPHRAAEPPEDCRRILVERAAIEFDPELVDSFLAFLDSIDDEKQVSVERRGVHWSPEGAVE